MDVVKDQKTQRTENPERRNPVHWWSRTNKHREQRTENRQHREQSTDDKVEDQETRTKKTNKNREHRTENQEPTNPCKLKGISIQKRLSNVTSWCNDEFVCVRLPISDSQSLTNVSSNGVSLNVID